jgi:hypothetical protein
VQLTPDQVAFLTNPAIIQQEMASPVFRCASRTYTALAAASSGMALDGKWPATLGGFSGFATSLSTSDAYLFCAEFLRATAQSIGNFPVSEHTDSLLSPA